MNATDLVDFVDQRERRLRQSREAHKIQNSRQRTFLDEAIVTECKKRDGDTRLTPPDCR